MKIKCPKCKEISTSTEWDEEAADKRYGRPSDVSFNKVYPGSWGEYYFYCPKCNKEIDGEHIVDLNFYLKIKNWDLLKNNS